MLLAGPLPFLPKTHVAADQAIHRFVGFHVLFDGSDCSELIFGFFKRKVFAEGFVILLAVFKSVPFTAFAQSIDIFKSSAAVSLTILAAFFFRFSQSPFPKA